MPAQKVTSVEMQKLRPKAIKKVRNKLRELIKSRKGMKQVQLGPFDEACYSALKVLDGEI
jgi:hypothetical protein